MKRIITAISLIILITGCSSTQKGPAPDTVSGASKAWGENKLEKLTGEKKGPVLIVYFTRTGNTQRAALRLTTMLDADAERIVDLKKAGYFSESIASMFNMTTKIKEPQYNPADYEYVIIGTPIWFWSMTPAARAYINKYKGSFKNLAFLVTAGGTQADGIVLDMEELSGQKSFAYIGFVEEEFQDMKSFDSKLKGFAKKFLK